MVEAFHAEPVRPDELRPALRLLFQHVPPAEREGRVQNALHLVHEGELDPAGVWVVRSSRALLGALVCLPVPGASGLVWPPQAVAHGQREAIQDCLLHQARAWLRQRGAKLVQTLLSAQEIGLASSLERNGFRHITSLWYFRHDLGFEVDLLEEHRRLIYQDYTHCDRAVFQQTLLQTYFETQDCPEVNGVRHPNEVLEGHQAQGTFDPRRWWLALEDDRPVGVLLLTEIKEWQGWDVSYVGVVAAARRRGVGRELTRKALQDARAAGAMQLTLAVDARNQPAWHLYRGLGFEQFDQREVFLAIV
jgi:ribosomal protein S18 acetylase RimI-like enzyme